MSLQNGWAALNLEMPARVPHTEYSIDSHWELIRIVTGLEVEPTSAPAEQARASQAFRRAWNFDFAWSTLIAGQIFGDVHTSMGHAEYAAGAVDWNPVCTCPFNSPEEVIAFDPWATYGPREGRELTRAFEEHYRKNCADYPDEVNMTGIYTTCISGLIDIFGWDMLLLGLGYDGAAFGAMVDRYASWMQQYFDALAAADVPAVMIHDDIVWTSGPFVHPDFYRQHVFPNYRKYFAPLLESGKKIIYTSDGNYSLFIDDIVACGVHGLVMEPSTDMAYVAERYGKTHAFIGNADTRILLSGTHAQIRAEVERCMAIGKGCPGFFMAVGNHIPANTPIANALYYQEVYEELSRR